MFELLQGTATPISSLNPPLLPTLSETPTGQITISTVTSTPAEPFYKRIGPIGIILLAVLALLIPLVIVLRDLFREK
jgi:hypothetical protein